MRGREPLDDRLRWPVSRPSLAAEPFQKATRRRNPDARLRLSESDLQELLPKQGHILDSAQALVRIGGRLVYATCSLLQEENEAQVSAFLARHSGFSLVPLARAWPSNRPTPCAGDFLSLTPARHGTDGFFAAVLERTA